MELYQLMDKAKNYRRLPITHLGLPLLAWQAHSLLAMKGGPVLVSAVGSPTTDPTNDYVIDPISDIATDPTPPAEGEELPSNTFRTYGIEESNRRKYADSSSFINAELVLTVAAFGLKYRTQLIGR